MKVILAFASTGCVGASDETGLLQQKVISAHDTPTTGNTLDGSQCPCGSCSNGCAPAEKITSCEDSSADVTTAFANGDKFDSAGGKRSALSSCQMSSSCMSMHWIGSCENCQSNTMFLDFPEESTNEDRVVGPPACLGGAGSVCTCVAAEVVAIPATGLFLSCAKVPRGVHSSANYQGWVDWCNGIFCSTLTNIDTFGCHERCECDTTTPAATPPTSGQTSSYPQVGDYCDGMGNGCSGPDGLVCQSGNVLYEEMWDYRYLSSAQCTTGINGGVIPANLPLTLCGSSATGSTRDVTKKCGSAIDAPICSWYNPGSCQQSCVAPNAVPPGSTTGHACNLVIPNILHKDHCNNLAYAETYSKCCICSA